MRLLLAFAFVVPAFAVPIPGNLPGNDWAFLQLGNGVYQAIGLTMGPATYQLDSVDLRFDSPGQTGLSATFALYLFPNGANNLPGAQFTFLSNGAGVGRAVQQENFTTPAGTLLTANMAGGHLRPIGIWAAGKFARLNAHGFQCHLVRSGHLNGWRALLPLHLVHR
jgi:hypothetical protein